MTKMNRNHIVLLIILTLCAILFIALSDIININNNGLHSMFLVIASFIIVMTIFIILKMIIQKYPLFLENGIWSNPFNTLFIGTFALFTLGIVFMFIHNSIELRPLFTRALTFMMAYPILFVLILMIDAFYKRIFAGNRVKRLFISSMTIVLGLAMMILLSLLSTT